ncbi:YitT family protein [Paenibacillus sp. CECT 9249]|uniref:YitT family protein n=1 Tax=unclassified Paenibacillus TaxID=185978 RepID=UPI001C1264BA|nr:YitT family protein [Paenibacillus sp. CECT 9249]MBU5442090.1 YitT family protein [Paenibacillus sp. MSJ-34]CAH0117592.1 hypothetical protein PAE9249_00052 [Paenibacillus sp. CECT 9249]
MRRIWDYIAVIIGAAAIAAGSNLFIIPHHLLSGGVGGVAMITGYFTDWNIGILYFVYNVPILAVGWFLLGKRFVLLSTVSVITTTWLMQVIPVHQFNAEPILGALFGGVLVGFGSGLSMRVGGSSGGFDVIGSIVTRYRDLPIGNILVIMNFVVIIALGYLKQNWDPALFSVLTIFIASKVIDFIHISHIKVTAFIITNCTEQMLEKLLTLPRGVTIIKTKGAFTHVEKDMLMTVTTRYELAELKRIIKTIDPKAFVNIVETVGVVGSFRRRGT